MISRKTIKDIIFELEASPDLYRYRTAGFSTYFMLRFNLEMILTRHYEGAFHSPAKSWKDALTWPARKVKARLSSLQDDRKYQRSLQKFDTADAIRESPFLFVSTSGQMTPEKASVELPDLVKHYKSMGGIVNFVQPLYGFDTPLKQAFYDAYLPLLNHVRQPLTAAESKQLRGLLTYLSEHLEPDFEGVFESCRSLLERCKYKAAMLEDYALKAQSKILICRSLYTEPWVIMAACRAGARCIDVQHGVYTGEVVYYQSSLPVEQLGEATLLMPDYLLTLGREWNDIIIGQHYVFDASNTMVIGTGAYNGHAVQSQSVRPVKGQTVNLMVATQPAIFNIMNWLDGFLERYSDELVRSNIALMFRPHPSEPLDDYGELVRKHPHIASLQNAKEVSIHQALDQVSAVFSGSSMCLYEALAYGKAAITPAYLKDLTVPDHITFVAGHEELMALLRRIAIGEGGAQKRVEYLTGFKPDVFERIIGAATLN